MQEPFLSSRLELVVWDHNRFFANSRIATLVLDMPQVTRPGGIPLAWHPLYGAPDVVNNAKPADRMTRYALHDFSWHAITLQTLFLHVKDSFPRINLSWLLVAICAL